jgi:hypothetical protein
MKGRTLIVILVLIGSGFFHFFNANQILRSTQKTSRLEKAFQAERNINTELKIEHDELTSDKYISTCIPAGMSKTASNEEAGNLVFIQEPLQQKNKPNYYCIIDLLTPKAEAITSVQPD